MGTLFSTPQEMPSGNESPGCPRSPLTKHRVLSLLFSTFLPSVFTLFQSLRFYFPQWPFALQFLFRCLWHLKATCVTSSDFSARTGADGHGLWPLTPQPHWYLSNSRVLCVLWSGSFLMRKFQHPALAVRCRGMPWVNCSTGFGKTVSSNSYGKSSSCRVKIYWRKGRGRERCSGQQPAGWDKMDGQRLVQGRYKFYWYLQIIIE